MLRIIEPEQGERTLTLFAAHFSEQLLNERLLLGSPN